MRPSSEGEAFVVVKRQHAALLHVLSKNKSRFGFFAFVTQNSAANPVAARHTTNSYVPETRRLADGDSQQLRRLTFSLKSAGIS